MVVEKSKTFHPYYKQKAKDFLLEIYYRIFRLPKLENVRLGANIRLNRGTEFEGYNTIYHNVDVRSSKIGRATYISQGSSLPYTKIGRYCSIGQNCNVIIGNHPIENNVATHPAFYSLLSQAGFHFAEETIYESSKHSSKNFVVNIGNGVWLGDYVKIINGVTIGDGAVVAAGALVTKDVPPHSIVGGVPAKLIRNRFSDEDIEFLINHPWYDFSFEKLNQNYRSFLNIEDYKILFEKNKLS
ncbi:MAG: CatB-related O-acetyltransferase [Clostridia bacterium]|nr:CatB-related O-acetyltransferase [Clostridia bacterium]